jgi:hypothetical protein
MTTTATGTAIRSFAPSWPAAVLVGQCDNLTMNGCDRVQRLFSCNETLYNGDDRNNNAMVLNDARAIVASFYPAMDCLSDQQCDDQIDTTLDICDPLRRVCIFLPRIQTAAGSCYFDTLQSFYRSFWQTMAMID